MPLPVIPQTIRAAVRGQCAGGAAWVNVHHYKDFGGTSWPSTLVTTLHTALTNLYTPAGLTGTPGILAYCNAATVSLDVQYIKLDGLSATETRAMAIAGNAAGDSLPAQNALVVTLRTGLRGRSKRGRLFLPPFAENQNDGTGRLLATALPILNTLFVKHIAALSSGAITWEVASYKLSSTQTITLAEVNTVFDAQRRRKQ